MQQGPIKMLAGLNVRLSSADSGTHAGKLRAAPAKGAQAKTSDASLQVLKHRTQRAQQAVTALLAAATLPDQGGSVPACLAKLQRVLAISTPQSTVFGAAADQQASAGLQPAGSEDSRSRSTSVALPGLRLQTELAGLATGIASIPNTFSWDGQPVGQPDQLTAAVSAAQRSMPHPAACASLLHLVCAHSRDSPTLAARLGQRLTQALLPAAARGAKVGALVPGPPAVCCRRH